MKTLAFLTLSLALCGQTLVNSGGPAVNGFSADFGYSGGSSWGPSNQASLGTADLPDIYRTLRYSTNNSGFSYDFIEPVGQCDLTLHLLEPNKTGPGQRVFAVTANGNQTGPLDVFALAGGAMKPYSTMVPGIWVLDGHLRIQFTPLNGKGNAIVSGIEVRCHAPVTPLTLSCIAPMVCAFDPAANGYTIQYQPMPTPPTASIKICQTSDCGGGFLLGPLNAGGLNILGIPAPPGFVPASPPGQ